MILLNYVSIFIMLAIFFYYGFRILWQYRAAKNHAKGIAEKLAEVRNNPDIAQRIHEFNNWVVQQTSSPKYIRAYLKPSWEYFYQKYVHHQRGGINLVPDVYDFFLEDTFIHKYGKRKFAEVIPGIFLAIGIIGTFVGIAVGIGGLQPNGDSEALKNGVTVLLSGMEVKFLSSIAGISLSLVWQWLDRNQFYPMLTESFTVLRREMDITFPTYEDNTILYQMHQDQTKKINENQAYLKDVFLPEMVRQFTEALRESVVPPIEKAHEKFANMQMEGLDEMVQLFVGHLDRAAGNQMKAFGETLRHTIEWHERVHSDLLVLTEELKRSTEHQTSMADRTNELADRMQGFSEAMNSHQNSLQEHVSSMTATSGHMSLLQKDTLDLMTTVAEEREAMERYSQQQHEYAQTQVYELQSSIDALTLYTSKQVAFQQQLERMNIQFNNLQLTQENLSKALSGQAEKTQETSRELTNSLQAAAKYAETFGTLHLQVGALLDSTAKQHQQLHAASQQTIDSFRQQIEQMDHRAERMDKLWSQNERVTAEMHLALNQVAADMQKGYTMQESELAKLADVFNQSLFSFTNVVAGLQDSIHQLRGELESRVATPSVTNDNVTTHNE